MNVGILYFGLDEFGLGHHYRCVQLAEKLEEDGHTVYMFSNFQFRRKLYFQLRPHNEYDLYHVLYQCDLDWLVIDTPYYPDDFVFKHKDQLDFRILYLNSDKDYPQIDVNIIQGCLSGTHSGPQWVIVRKSLSDYQATVKTGLTFVFGGSEDSMDLLSNFTKYAKNEQAILVGGKVPEKVTENHIFTIPNDDASFLGIMSSSSKAVIQFGMTAWELVYYGVPTYAFSPTTNHLRWAQAMENEGLIKAYPDTGIPSSNQIMEFINEPFEINEDSRSKLDTYAVDRIVELMEDYA